MPHQLSRSAANQLHTFWSACSLARDEYVLTLNRQKEVIQCVCVQVMGGVGGHHTAAEGRYLMLGNGFLLMNTLAMALYYLR